MPVRLEDRFRRFIQIVKVTELMGHLRQAALHCLADRLLSIRNHPPNWHRYCLLDLTEQSGEIPSRTAEQGPCQQHLAADIWLHPIDSQQHLALLLEPGLYSRLICQMQGD